MAMTILVFLARLTGNEIDSFGCMALAPSGRHSPADGSVGGGDAYVGVGGWGGGGGKGGMTALTHLDLGDNIVGTHGHIQMGAVPSFGDAEVRQASTSTSTIEASMHEGG